MARFTTAIVSLIALFCATSAATVPSTQHTAKHFRSFFFQRFFAEKCLAQPTLICNVLPTEGNNVRGRVLFSPVYVKKGHRFRCLTKVTARVENLPGKAHGFHIHMYGDLSAPDGLSTGPHFANPQGIPVEHGFSSDAIRHWGDLDNLIADENGVAEYERIDDVIRIGGIIGRGITIHIGEDMGADFQPTGNAGARIGVCTIGFANPSSLE